jgi:hypothetical protein
MFSCSYNSKDVFRATYKVFVFSEKFGHLDGKHSIQVSQGDKYTGMSEWQHNIFRWQNIQVLQDGKHDVQVYSNSKVCWCAVMAK